MADLKISSTSVTDITTLQSTDMIPVERVSSEVAYRTTPDEINSYITGGAINARLYATGDGVSDDTVGLQAFFDAVTDNKTGIIPAGTYLISNPLNFKTRYRIELIGLGEAIIQAKTGSNFTDQCLLNLSGTTYSYIRNLSFLSTIASYQPATTLLYGRNAAGTGGDIHFERCGFYGDCTFAAMLFAQGDTSSFKDCVFQTRNANPSLFITSHNDSGYLDRADSTHTMNRFDGCWFYTTVATTTRLIVAQGLIQNLKFDTCFFSPTDGAACLSTEDSALAATANQIHKLTFINCQCEGSGAGALLLKVNNSYSVERLSIINLGWDTVSDYIIAIDSLINTNGLKNAMIMPQISLADATTKIIHLINGYLESSHITCANADIYTESGTIAQYNFIEGVYGSSPFGASLGTLQYNTVISGGLALMTANGFGCVPYAPPDLSTAIEARSNLLIVTNSLATNLSNIANYTSNQMPVCLVFMDGNTTVKQGNIHLAGSTDWNPLAGATLTLYCTADWVWYEGSRMTP